MSEKFQCRWLRAVSEIPQEAWDALAASVETPFLEWGWLHNLEISGCLTKESGWMPHHLCIQEGGKLVLLAPMYLKGHSYGEFVFDQEWATVAYRMGLEYYPKLLGSIPFTPAVGYRFLVAANADEETVTRQAFAEIDTFCRKSSILGCHFLFVDHQWRKQIENFGFHSWMHQSLIWENRDFQTFDTYLRQFRSHERRNIQRERKSIHRQKVSLKVFQTEEITEQSCALMYQFYHYTCSKFQFFSKYLTRKFFLNLATCFSRHLVLVAAYQEENTDPIAMSLLVHKNSNLYGRYWGGIPGVDSLHFETCYYTPIEWAIQNGIRSYDAGSGGGRHKKRRGFLARPNYSLHRFYHPIYNDIWQKNIRLINTWQEEEIEILNAGVIKETPSSKC